MENRDGIYYEFSNNKTTVILTKDSDFYSQTWREILSRSQPLIIKGVGKNGLFFENCSAQIIDLRELDGSQITDTSEMFRFCSSEEIMLDNLDMSNVKNAECMFFECKTKLINLSNVTFGKLEQAYSMFSQCSAEMIVLNKSLSNLKNADYMFCECEAKNILFNGFTLQDVSSARHIFSNCEAHGISDYLTENRNYLLETNPDVFANIYKEYDEACESQENGIDPYDEYKDDTLIFNHRSN